MNAAILSFSTSLEVIAAFVIFFAILGFFLWLDYRRLCNKLPTKVEIDENRDFQWPPRNHKRAAASAYTTLYHPTKFLEGEYNGDREDA